MDGWIWVAEAMGEARIASVCRQMKDALVEEGSGTLWGDSRGKSRQED